MSDSFLTFTGISFLKNGPYSLEVKENTIVGIAGKSGVGKTQLFRALVGTIRCSGEVALDGVLSTQYEAPEWRKKVAMVAAEPAWWWKTAGEHFPAAQKSEVEGDLLGSLGFSREVLSWEIAKLSTGERQRLALMRALVLKPAVLLLDEPCSALDNDSVRRVEELVAAYVTKPKRACLWISHDIEQLRRVCHSCYSLKKGGLTALQ